MRKEWLFSKTSLSRREAGQAVLIMAMAFIGLLAITGVAIDGGGLLFLRRDAQNATDAAIIAATYAKCAGADFVEAGRLAAAENGFQHGADNVTVNITEVTGTGDYTTPGKYFIQVQINAEKPKYFIQIVYSGPLEVTTNAVGTCNPGYDFSNYKAALFGLGTGCSAGKGDVNVTGANQTIYGDIISFGDIKSTGSTSGRTIYGDVIAGGQTNNTIDGLVQNGGGTVTQNATAAKIGTNPSGLFDITDYAPGGDRAIAAQADGEYFHNTLPNPLHGLIYWDTGSRLSLNGYSFGGPTTIVTTDDLDIKNVSGNFDPYVDNLAIFSTHASSGCNASSGVQFSGNLNYFRGIIFAPYAMVAMSASENNGGAIIAKYIDVSGSNSIFRYDPLMFPPSLADIELSG